MHLSQADCPSIPSDSLLVPAAMFSPKKEEVGRVKDYFLRRQLSLSRFSSLGGTVLSVEESASRGSSSSCLRGHLCDYSWERGSTRGRDSKASSVQLRRSAFESVRAVLRMPCSSSGRRPKTSCSMCVTSFITYTTFYLFIQHVSSWYCLAVNKNASVVSAGIGMESEYFTLLLRDGVATPHPEMYAWLRVLSKTLPSC